jgi:hypothetical protein
MSSKQLYVQLHLARRWHQDLFQFYVIIFGRLCHLCQIDCVALRGRVHLIKVRLYETKPLYKCCKFGCMRPSPCISVVRNSTLSCDMVGCSYCDIIQFVVLRRGQ